MGHKPRRFWLYSICFVMVFASWLAIRPVSAAALTDTYVRFDRMKASTSSTVRIVFRTSATNGTEAKLKLTFSDGTTQTTGDNYTVNVTQAVSSASCAAETGATALPTATTLTAAGDNTAGSKDIIISAVSDLAVSTRYCVDLTTSTAITNPVAGGYSLKLATQTAADADIDKKYVGSRVISDDQIVVTAVVPPSFNFTLSGNSDSFINLLSSGSIESTTGRIVTITTNASKGWIAWVKSANAGLSSASAPYTIATTGTVNAAPSTLTVGAEGYVLDVNLETEAAGGGTVTIDPEYNGIGSGTDSGGTLSTTFQPIASANGTANGDAVKLIERAAISGVTPAGDDYTDTLTVVGAGNF